MAATTCAVRNTMQRRLFTASVLDDKAGSSALEFAAEDISRAAEVVGHCSYVAGVWPMEHSVPQVSSGLTGGDGGGAAGQPSSSVSFGASTRGS